MWPMPAVTVTSSLPRLHFRKVLEIRMEKAATKVLQNRPEKCPQNRLPQIRVPQIKVPQMKVP